MQAAKDRTLIATIGDEVRFPLLSYPFHFPTTNTQTHAALSRDAQDTITGLLLAGTGNVDSRGGKNFVVVDASACFLLSRRRSEAGERLREREGS